MKKVKVFIELTGNGYSAYMDDTPLSYSCVGEGTTVEDTIDDFNSAYEEMRSYYKQEGKDFEEISYEFYYDTASFLAEYAGILSLSGLEKITGVNQTQLGHYLHGRRRPGKKVVHKIQSGVEKFAKELTAIKFA